MRHAKALLVASSWLACRSLDHQHRFSLLQQGAFQQGEEVARLDLLCYGGEAVGVLLAATEVLVTVGKEESTAPLA